MPEQALLDNDVAMKIACYSLVTELIETTTIDDIPPAMLGVGRFVIRGRLDRALNVARVEQAKAAFEGLLDAVVLVEPDEAELAMAADFEAEASRRNLDLDSGESQLMAILVGRHRQYLATGDKRAIVAMATIARKMMTRRVVCLEQLMAIFLERSGFDPVRREVCAEPDVDRAITICFGCRRDAVNQSDVAEGLSSYIADLRRRAPDVLV